MARLRIIILEKHGDKLHYAMWADVPDARKLFYADANKVSAWKDALPADNAALQSGAVTEEAGHVDLSSNEGVVAIRKILSDRWADFQARINALNPWARYGATWDGTTWTNGGVA